MTGLDIVDTALKIGLGATLSGVFTWFGMRRAQSHEVEKERRRRRQDTIEKIAEEFEAASRVYVAATGALLSVNLGVGDGDKCLEAIRAVADARDDLTLVDGRLRLFGLHDAAERLEQLQLVADEMRAIAVNAVGEMRKLSSDEISEITMLGLKIRAAREAFYMHLAAGHRGP